MRSLPNYGAIIETLPREARKVIEECLDDLVPSISFPPASVDRVRRSVLSAVHQVNGYHLKKSGRYRNTKYYVVALYDVIPLTRGRQERRAVLDIARTLKEKLIPEQGEGLREEEYLGGLTI